MLFARTSWDLVVCVYIYTQTISRVSEVQRQRGLKLAFSEAKLEGKPGWLPCRPRFGPLWSQRRSPHVVNEV